MTPPTDANPPSAAPASAPTSRIAGLDGMRAVAILLVLIGHSWATLPSGSSLEWLAPYLGNASLGVTAFFAISGFLITRLLRQEWERTGTLDIRSFYIRRALRIFPAMYAFLLAVVALRWVGAISTTRGDIAAAGTFLANYKHLLPIPTGDDYWFVGHFWTLSLEEQFYLFWPATVLLFGLARAPRVALAIVVLSPVARVATYALFPGTRGQIGIMLHTAADPIMFGCLAALGVGHPRLEGAMRRLSSAAWPLLAGAFVSVVSVWLAARFRGAYLLPLGTTLDAASIAFVMLWVVRNPASVVGRILANPVLRHIGILSYSLYLWQQLFLTGRNHTWTGTFPFNLIACFVAAELSFRIVERPFLGLRHRFRR